MLNAILKRLVQSPKALRVIEDQGEALGSISDMLNSLLDISKLDAGVIIPDMQDHSVRQIFQGLRKQFAGLAETKGIDFVVDECRETIHSDPGLLMQILYNLVSNAIRYTSEGQVRIRCLHDKSFVGIQVLDTGIGIPHDQIEVVFKEFYQIHHGPKYKEGFGLGLAVVRRLTDLLGHRLELESQPGRGSCFSVYVPVGTTSEPDVRPSPVYRTEPTKSKVVLLVDDSLPVLDATRTLLEIEGFTTLTAASREEAMKRIDNGKVKPDIIVCDFHIPGTDNGLELIQDLRSVIGMEIPAVLATGDTSTSVKSLIRTINDCTLLNKPMRIDVLLETINSFTDKQQVVPGLKN
jgi:CheY-like chemotaxis protein/two-component sensor histidine kinase